MESASTLFAMPRQKTLRKGQREVIDASLAPGVTSVNAQLPTGYGKTFTACCVYEALQSQGRVNRMLYIVPSLSQLNQFVADGASDLADAGVSGPLQVVNMATVAEMALKYHRNNVYQIYAITVQSLTSGRLRKYVQEMLQVGRWMLVIDEYHHYGLEAHWGRKVNEMNYAFRLAMSATPYRPDDDSAFGPPDVTVSYQAAVEEQAVKPLRLHSYVYRIDLIDTQTAQIKTYTTEQLVEEIGSDKADDIDRFVLDRQMRWSPKYVSPLVDIPVARLHRERIETGYPLQMLVGAMSCLHAEMVCRQMHAMFPELRIDWVGTGPQGRAEKDNQKILQQFCPPKRNGKRDPKDIKLDVLVHVGMAGEGLDSVYVAEVVHLNHASINNSNHQENGRAARFLDGVTGYINVDSSSPYAPYSGEAIMALIDDPTLEPISDDQETERERTGQNDEDWEFLPEEPTIRIYDLECIRVDEGEVRRFAEAAGLSMGVSTNDLMSVLEDATHPHHDRLMRMAEQRYREMRSAEVEAFNLDSAIMQMRENVNNATSRITRLVICLMTTPGTRHEQSLAGDIIKRINQRKAQELGKINGDLDHLKRHYQWIRTLEKIIAKEGIPQWLQ